MEDVYFKGNFIKVIYETMLWETNMLLHNYITYNHNYHPPLKKKKLKHSWACSTMRSITTIFINATQQINHNAA